MDGKKAPEPVASTPDLAAGEPLLSQVAAALAACTGIDFFDHLVRYLARMLDVDFAYVGEIVGDRQQVETLSVCVRGEIAPNVRYDIRPTPCLIVVSDGFSAYNRDIRQLFPDDHLAVEMGVESYMGIALTNHAGEVIGLLTVMDSKPIANPRVNEWILRILSVRAAAELERVRSDAARRAAEQRFRHVLELPLVGVAVSATDKRWLEVNDRLCEMLGYPRDELLAMGWDQVSHGTDLPGNLELFERALRGEIDGYTLDKRFVRKDGSLVDARISARCVRGPRGHPDYFLVVADDITERRRTHERLQYLTRHDAVTQLPNRTVLAERLAESLARARQEGRRAAVLRIDLDRFGAFNELLGHHAGDRLLAVSAGRISGCVRADATVARLGGDEFAVVVPDIMKTSDAIAAAERLLATFAEPLVLDGQELFLGASIGISVFPDHADDVQSLLARAGAALACAKEDGRNTYRVYSTEMRRHAIDDMTLETDLRHAIGRGQLQLYYQPQVDARSGSIHGMEALIRWRHPQRGLISPAHFLPLAETAGLMPAIGAWVLRAAAEQAQIWRRGGHRSLRMSVNLSGRQFADPAILDTIESLLATTGLDPGALEIEMTEDTVMRDAPTTIARLQAIHALGVRLAIDDFGTGYSSLSYLARFPVQTLKIDRSFVHALAAPGPAAEIARTIVLLGHTLGLQVVAEGVETREQLAILHGQGCDLIQGYFFCEPRTAVDITRLLEGAGPVWPDGRPGPGAERD